MPPSRKPKALEPLAVQRGDVVLALFGKHQWLPALVSETTDCSAPTVLIEFFGDHAVGQQPRAKLRPFADLETMSSRSQPQSAAHGRAVAEARRWLTHLSSPPLPPLPPLLPASEVFAHEEQPKVMLKLRGASSSWRINGEPVPAALLKRATLPPPDLAALPTPSFRLASSGAAAGDESLDSVSDEAFTARHAKFEKLERRGFAAHQRAVAAGQYAEPEAEQPSSSSTWRAPPPSPGAIAALSRRRAQVQASRLSRSPSKRVRGEISAQLLGQRLLVPTSIFGDDRSEGLVYEGRVVRRTRGRADCVDVTFKVDGVTCSFAATQALLWLDLSELEGATGDGSGDSGGSGGRRQAAAAAEAALVRPPRAVLAASRARIARAHACLRAAGRARWTARLGHNEAHVLLHSIVRLQLQGGAIAASLQVLQVPYLRNVQQRGQALGTCDQAKEQESEQVDDTPSAAFGPISAMDARRGDDRQQQPLRCCSAAPHHGLRARPTDPSRVWRAEQRLRGGSQQICRPITLRGRSGRPKADATSFTKGGRSARRASCVLAVLAGGAIAAQGTGSATDATGSQDKEGAGATA